MGRKHSEESRAKRSQKMKHYWDDVREGRIVRNLESSAGVIESEDPQPSSISAPNVREGLREYLSVEEMIAIQADKESRLSELALQYNCKIGLIYEVRVGKTPLVKPRTWGYWTVERENYRAK